MSPLCRTVSQTDLSSLKLTYRAYNGGVDEIRQDSSMIPYFYTIFNGDFTQIIGYILHTLTKISGILYGYR